MRWTLLQVRQYGLHDSKIAGVKSASVGCVKEPFSDPGHVKKRNVIAETLITNMTRAKMKRILPIVSSPSNLCGVAYSTSATPPVERGSVNCAQVKLQVISGRDDVWEAREMLTVLASREG